MTRTPLLSFLLLLGSCFAGGAAARTPQEILADGYLVIGTSGTAPPYSSLDSHAQLTGFDVELGESIARSLGVKVRWKQIDFRGLLPALASGQLDLVMSGVRIRAKLQQTFLFSNPYSYEKTVAITAKADPGVTTLRDLRGRSVAVVASSFQEDFVKAEGGYRELLSLPNGTDIFLAMHTGHASVGIVGISAAEHYQRQHLDAIRVVLSGAPLVPQGIVMAKQSTALKLFVDSFLSQIRHNGRYSSLYQKYFGRLPSE